MVNEKQTCSQPCTKDWAGDWRTLMSVWGVPATAMLAALFFDPGLRAVVWMAALVWMGGACLANARRCGRTHCRFTGPFFLVMATLVLAYAVGALPLGSYGWVVLGVLILAGNAVIWWVSERILGTFRGRARQLPYARGQSLLVP